MITVNRSLYVLIPRGVNGKTGDLVIDIREMGAPNGDTICEFTLPLPKNSMPDPNLLEYILRWVRRWYLPENTQPCELAGLKLQLVVNKNKWIEYLARSIPAKNP